MIRAAALSLLLWVGEAAAYERLGVVAVADPPAGPDADLAELGHQLRAACRDRVGGVEDVPTMRARLLGQTSSATLSELDRAYGGALAVYQNGEFESALRTLHAIVEDLESLPETEDSYSQWVRAQLRLAHAALTIGREAEADAAFHEVARTDPAISADPNQYSPSYRRRFDAIKAKVRALGRRRLTVTSEGKAGSVFVNGRPMGTTPLSLWLPAGSYRIGGAAGSLRVPSFRVDAEADDQAVVLDFALAESLRVNAGPGLALPAPRRGDGIVRAGAWLGVDRIIAVSRVFEGEAAFLLGSIYDVRRGSLLREGSVRMVAGGVPAANLGALAAFLLTGQSQRDVRDRTEAARERMTPAVPASRPEDPAPAYVSSPEPAPAAPAPNGEAKGSLAAAPAPVSLEAETRTAVLTREGRGREARGWMRPAAWGTALASAGLAALAIQQGLAARSAYTEAEGLVGPGGVFLGDPARYRALRADGDSATRNAYLSAGAAAAFAAAAGALGWLSRDRAPEPGIAFRF